MSASDGSSACACLARSASAASSTSRRTASSAACRLLSAKTCSAEQRTQCARSRAAAKLLHASRRTAQTALISSRAANRVASGAEAAAPAPASERLRPLGRPGPHGQARSPPCAPAISFPAPTLPRAGPAWPGGWLETSRLRMRGARQRAGFMRFGRLGSCLRTPPGRSGFDLRHRLCNVLDNDWDDRSLARRAGEEQARLLPTGLVWPSSSRDVKSTLLPTGGAHHDDAAIEAGRRIGHQLRRPRRTGGAPLCCEEIHQRANGLVPAEGPPQLVVEVLPLVTGH